MYFYPEQDSFKMGVLILRLSKHSFIDIFKVTYCVQQPHHYFYVLFRKRFYFTFYSQYAKLLRSYL